MRRAGVDEHADDTARARSNVGAAPAPEVGAREKGCHDVLELLEASIAARFLPVPRPLIAEVKDGLVAAVREVSRFSQSFERICNRFVGHGNRRNRTTLPHQLLMAGLCDACRRRK
jgi:hypothetical protein